MSLDEKTCIVAGGGNGLGKATAIELGKLGASVVVNDLGTDAIGRYKDPSPARKVAESIEENGGRSLAHFGDVTSIEYTQQLIEDVADTFGQIDAVMNFAGIVRTAPLHEMSEEDWDDVIRVHLRSNFSLLRSISRYWRANDDILNCSYLVVSSRSALGGVPENIGMVNYSTAKAGALGLTRASARELAEEGIRVNAIIPSAQTRMVEEVVGDEREKAPGPQKVAPFAGYLMSDQANNINGCTFRVKGDLIGLVSEPTISRLGIKVGGWSFKDLEEGFQETVTSGINLDKTGERPL